MPPPSSQYHLIITVPTRVTYQKIWDNLTAALEGGSNYWIQEARVLAANTRPQGIEVDAMMIATMEKNDRNYCFLQDVPFCDGCLEIKDMDGAWHTLTIAQLQRGLMLMANEAPEHFGALVAETGDAETGDVMLQFAVFGELVYG